MTDAGSILFPSCPEIVQILFMNIKGRCCLDWDMQWWLMSLVTHARTVYLCNRHLYFGKKVIFLTLDQEIFANTCRWKALLKDILLRVGRPWFNHPWSTLFSLQSHISIYGWKDKSSADFFWWTFEAGYWSSGKFLLGIWWFVLKDDGFPKYVSPTFPSF